MSWRKTVSLLIKRQQIKTIIRRQSTTMPCLHVRHVENDDRIQISFNFSHNGKERQFNLNRHKSEELSKSLERLTQNIKKFTDKKKSKKQKLENTDISNNLTIKLLHNDISVDQNWPNSEAWKNGSVLHIDDTTYTVTVNPPTILKLEIPDSIMAGFTIYLKYEFEFVDIAKSSFEWFIDIKSENDQGASSSNVVEWKKVSDGFLYTPSLTEIGHKLKLKCKPSDGERFGDAKDVYSTVNIESGPGICPFENRHLYTKRQSDPGCFRVITYNILADTYADSDFSRETLFPYCPPYALALDYRKQLLLKEVKGYNADVICLQEVDKKVFINELQPVLDIEGFDGMLKLKNGQVPEGSSIFYRRSKFRLLGKHDLNMVEELKSSEKYQDLYEKICQKEAYKEKMLDRNTTLQVAVLESCEDPSRKLCVATSHFFFHPKACNIRLVQAYICLQHLESVRELYKDQGTLSFLFCGDLNSAPTLGVYQLITTKDVGPDHPDWSSGGEEEYLKDMELSHKFNLKSACGTPKYTNYVGGFNGCLDYIFMDSDSLETVQVIPMPSHEEVIQHTALPSVVFPSDHIAQIADLTWK
ncbi:unnamed protein product [Owenia fusiformis]|uniref:2',5'-phosphodiesterase 12 n=1 Tax=Owenia fusiformis TaxID=6347 RepID=A0A8J1UII0_OWEFU|nr:unnamed protein product [Owenia fusiformis]